MNKPESGTVEDKATQRQRKLRIGEQMVSAGLITTDQLNEAIKRQDQVGGHIGSLLIELGFISVEDLLNFLSDQHGVPGVNLYKWNIDEDVLGLVALEEITEKMILPIAADEETITLAMVNPQDFATISEIQFLLGKKVKPVVAPSFMIKAAMKSVGTSSRGGLQGESLMEMVEMEGGAKSPRLKTLLQYVVKINASDLLMTAGAAPSVKVNGTLKRLAIPSLTPGECERYARELLTDEAWAEFSQTNDYGFGATYANIGRFRITVFRQRGSISIALRPIKDQIPSFDQLNLPAWLNKFALRPQGLILVSGPAGHGKTTTLAAMVDLINNNRGCNILTLEDPVEFLCRHKKSNISQREVGRDTVSFAEGIKHVFRQAPDVIVVGEMRDKETFEIGLRAANSGHLVITTVHSDNSTSIIERIINMFEPHQQALIRMMLSDSLLLSIAQRLLPLKSGEGRILALERFINSNRVRKYIREGKSSVIRAQMQAGTDEFKSLDSALADLYNKRLITVEDALVYVEDESFFADLIGGIPV